jgi:phosphonate transport system substrate-binding protein
MDPDAAAAARYTFGVVPQFEQRKLYSIWKPIIDELQRRTGLDFTLVTTLKIQDFEKEFSRGGFDFVYMNPYYVLKARETGGYLPLLRDKPVLRGILVVPKDSGLVKVQDLDGKVVAFPSPNAVGASLLMRADLERIHHVSVKPLYVKTHSSVYLHVVTGLAAAGGGVEKTLQEQERPVRDSLRVIYTTRSIPSHPIAAHSRVPKEHREKVRQALLEMGTTPEGRDLLSKVPIKQLVSSSLDDYREMFGWGLDAYWDAGWSGD